ncbi:MAG: hypothetical protein JWQ28_2632 [Pedobacter sp.]|nr:hypothetical protein [Pedobacter sp.]
MAALALFLNACKKDNTKIYESNVAYGKTVALGSGTAQSFVIKDANGNPQTIGFTFTEKALLNLPSTNTMTTIPAPANNGTLVDHMCVDFNAKGHEPAGIYNVPHFDLHFYMIPEAEQMAIVNGVEMENIPSSEYFPADYAPIPGGDPMMGKHWADLTSKEFTGHPFDRTFIYGSYNGKFIFHEAMVTLEFFKSKKNFTDLVKQQTKVQREGFYPKTYSVTYNAAKKVYTVTLDQLSLKHI